MSMLLQVDPEFESFLVDCHEEDDAALEASLVECGGARDPIVVWKGHGVIVDGHRRYKICQRLGLPYRVEEIHFDDRTAVLKWMANWQFMRRNMTPAQRAVLVHRIVNQRTIESPSAPVTAVVREVAEQTQRSERQVYRDAAAGKVLDTAPEEIREVALEMPLSEVSQIWAIPESAKVEIVSIHDKGERKKRIKSEIAKTKSKGKPTGPCSRTLQDATELLALLQKKCSDISRQVDDAHGFKTLRFHFKGIDDMLDTWRRK